MDNNLTNDFEVRLATLERLGGDMTKDYANIFEVDLAILEKTQGGGVIIDDTEVSTGKVWSSYKINTELTGKANSADVYNKTQINASFNAVDASIKDTYNKNEVDGFVSTLNQSISTKANSADVYTKSHIDTSITNISTALDNKANSADVYTKSQIDTSLNILIVKEGDTWTAEQAAKFHALRALPAEQFLKKFAVAKNIGGNTFIMLYPKEVIYNSDGTGGTLFFTALYNNQYWTGGLTTPQISGGDTVSFTGWETIGYAHITDVDASLATKQATLVSGTNIKTINNNSILGSGNIDIQGGGGAGVVELTQAEYDALAIKDPSIIYNITDASVYVMEDYFSKAAADASFGLLDTKYNPKNSVTPYSTGSTGYFVSWNSYGLITGKGNYAYMKSFNVNGNSNTLYATSNVAMPSIYAATTAGTSGQVLQSTGSGAPQWVDFRSDATYYISESDCSTGTYSNDISAFYADCIASEHIGPMQLVNDTEHTEGEQTYTAHSYYYPSSTRLYEGNVELWFFTTETGATWRNFHVLITNSTVTADVTTGTFGS